MKKDNKEVNIHIRITNKMKEKYKSFCKRNGFVFAKRIRVIMEKDMKGEIK